MTPATEARIRQALALLGDALTEALADERANSAPDRLLTVADVCEALSVHRSKVYALIASGELRSLKVGDLRRVPSSAIRRYVELASGNGRAGPAVEDTRHARRSSR